MNLVGSIGRFDFFCDSKYRKIRTHLATDKHVHSCVRFC